MKTRAFPTRVGCSHLDCRPPHRDRPGGSIHTYGSTVGDFDSCDTTLHSNRLCDSSYITIDREYSVTTDLAGRSATHFSSVTTDHLVYVNGKVLQDKEYNT